MVIPRTSEQEHKLYLYLREVIRQGGERPPEPILYNLLHARSAEAEAYGLERTQDLRTQLERVMRSSASSLKRSRRPSRKGMPRARQSAICCEQREGPAPRLPGTEALPLIGAWYFMGRSEYATLAREALREIETRPPLEGPRILIKGSPLDSPEFCAAIEAHGAIVVAEDDWWGSRAAGQDIDATMDPIRAIFEKYYFDAPSPRVFPG